MQGSVRAARSRGWHVGRMTAKKGAETRQPVHKKKGEVRNNYYLALWCCWVARFASHDSIGAKANERTLHPSLSTRNASGHTPRTHPSMMTDAAMAWGETMAHN